MGAFWFAYFTVFRLGRIGRELELTRLQMRRDAARARGEIVGDDHVDGGSGGAGVIVLMCAIVLVGVGFIWFAYAGGAFNNTRTMNVQNETFVGSEVGVGKCDQFAAQPPECRPGGKYYVTPRSAARR